MASVYLYTGAGGGEGELSMAHRFLYLNDAVESVGCAEYPIVVIALSAAVCSVQVVG